MPLPERGFCDYNAGKGASVIGKDTSVIGNGASVIVMGPSVIGNGASVIIMGPSVNRSGVSVIAMGLERQLWIFGRRGKCLNGGTDDQLGVA